MIIRAHYDTDLFEGDLDYHLIDVRATLRAFSVRLETALRSSYPDADVRVSFDANTAGGSLLTVTDDAGSEVDDLYAVDAVRVIVDRVFEGDWRVKRDERNA